MHQYNQIHFHLYDNLVSICRQHIDPMQKGVSLFFSYTNMKKIKRLHHVKEHPKISNFLQFDSHSNKSFKVRAISYLRDLYMEIRSKA